MSAAAPSSAVGKAAAWFSARSHVGYVSQDDDLDLTFLLTLCDRAESGDPFLYAAGSAFIPISAVAPLSTSFLGELTRVIGTNSDVSMDETASRLVAVLETRRRELRIKQNLTAHVQSFRFPLLLRGRSLASSPESARAESDTVGRVELMHRRGTSLVEACLVEFNHRRYSHTAPSPSVFYSRMEKVIRVWQTGFLSNQFVSAMMHEVLRCAKLPLPFPPPAPAAASQQQMVSHSASSAPLTDAEKTRAFTREIDFNLRRRFPARKSLELALALHPPSEEIQRVVRKLMNTHGDLEHVVVTLRTYLLERETAIVPASSHAQSAAASAPASYVQVAVDPRYAKTDFQLARTLYTRLSAGATLFPSAISFVDALQSVRRLTPKLLAIIMDAKTRLIGGYPLKEAEDELRTALKPYLNQFGEPEVELVHPRRSNTVFISAVDSTVALIGKDRLVEAVKLYLATRRPQESLEQQISSIFRAGLDPVYETNRIALELNHARSVFVRASQAVAASAMSTSAAAAAAPPSLLPAREMARAPIAVAAAAPSNPSAHRPVFSVNPRPPAPILSRPQQQLPKQPQPPARQQQQQPPRPQPQVNHPMDVDPPAVVRVERPAAPAAVSDEAMVEEAPQTRMQTCAHICGCINERSYSSTLHVNPIAVDSEEVEEHQCYGTLHPRCTRQCPGHSLLYNPKFNVSKKGWTSYPMEWIHLWMMDYEELRPRVDRDGLTRAYLLKLAKEEELPLPGSDEVPTTMIQFLDTQAA
jgi:hypothetical protein